MANILPVLLGSVATALVGVLVYVATRKRDKPSIKLAEEQLEVAKKVAADEGAKAASEAWAEYAAAMERRLEAAEERLERCEKREAALQTRLDKIGGTT